MKKPKTKTKLKPQLTRRDSHVNREKHARDALVKLPPQAQTEHMPNGIHPLLYNLLVPLANGKFIHASQSVTTITNKRDRRLAMTPYEVSITAPPSAQPITHEEDGDINVEDHIQEGDHDELDIEDMDIWESNNPRQEKHKFTPMQTSKTTPAYVGEIGQHAPVQAVKYNPEHVSRLQSLLWQRGLTANFNLVESTPASFSGTVSFAGETIHTEGSFSSKRLAREALSKVAIPIAEKYDPNSKKRKNSDDQIMDDGTITEDVLNSANWAGSLQNYTQAHKLPMPDYTEFRTPYPPHLFSCTVRVANSLALFGSETTLYSSKSAAKKAAAREAVLWVRSQGAVFPEAQVTGGPLMKRRKSGDLYPAAAVSGMTGLTQVMQDVDVNKLSHLSLAQQVHEVVASMGFSQPQWHSKPSGNGAYGPSWVDVSAIFSKTDVSREPRLAGEICTVEKVFGKKQGKEECCKRVLVFLEELKRGRSG
ncbi:hypothetical protein LTS10_000422 [Elasticomyces elasticus]|nr:hypothetical protein LTS10_000422 [Elasticomyces elasticus]